MFANQMKTVFSEVYDRPVYSESGLEIDAIFGQKSIDDRIVSNPAIIGTTTTLLEVGFFKALAVYRAATKA